MSSYTGTRRLGNDVENHFYIIQSTNGSKLEEKLGTKKSKIISMHTRNCIGSIKIKNSFGNASGLF